MKDFILRKKLLELNRITRERLNYFFDGATNSAHDFVDKFKSMSNKTRLHVVKSLGAGILSVLVLAGFTGCMDEQGNIIDTPAVTASDFESSPILDKTTEPTDNTEIPNDDIPADADGYKYPEFFSNLVHDSFARFQLLDLPINRTQSDGVNYSSIIANTPPEIIFIHREDRPLDTENGEPRITIYAKTPIDEPNSKYVYTKYIFGMTPQEVYKLQKPELYNSYEEYISKIQELFEKKLPLNTWLEYADISDLLTEQDQVNENLGENFANFIGENFVDATIMCVNRFPYRPPFRTLSGFAYDKDGNSYSYKFAFSYDSNVSNYEIIQMINSGQLKKSDLPWCFEDIQEIKSVFQERIDELD